MAEDTPSKAPVLSLAERARLHPTTPWEPPRVPVTASTLYAYSVMRGNNNKKNFQFGQLHEATYIEAKRAPDGEAEKPFLLPFWELNDKLMTEPAFVVYYDPILPHGIGPPKHAEKLDEFGFSARTSLPEMRTARSFSEPQNLHYTGQEGFGNHGYVLVNGSWVDPDSEGEVFNAVTNSEQASKSPALPITPQGPCIMDPATENAFYEEMTAELAYWGDLQGDPRNLRITPQTFAQWATGVSQGDKYVNHPVPMKMNIPSIDTSPKPRLRDMTPQFDVETGSMISGVYEPSQISMILSAKGVDPLQRPVNFARSYPQANIDIDHAAFGDGTEDNDTEDRIRYAEKWLSTSSASAPIVLRSEGAWAELATPEDPLSGATVYEEKKQRISDLRETYQGELNKNIDLFIQTNEIEAKKAQLHREIYFMKHEIQKQKSTSSIVNQPSMSPPSAMPADLSNAQRRGPRRPYKDYLDEVEQRGKLSIVGTQLSNLKMTEDLERSEAQLDPLLKRHEQLRKELGMAGPDNVKVLLPRPRSKERM